MVTTAGPICTDPIQNDLLTAPTCLWWLNVLVPLVAGSTVCLICFSTTVENEHHAFVIAVCFNEIDNHFVAMAMVFLVSLGYHVQKLYPVSWRYSLSVGFWVMLVTNSY